MDDLKRNAVISLISSYASQFVTTAANLATKIILARLIAPSDLGLYALALFVLMAGDMLVDMGISQHLVREKHRPYGNVLLMRLAVGVVVYAAILAFGDTAAQWSRQLPALIQVMGVVVIIKAVSGVPSIFLDRELLVHKTLIPQVSRLLTMGVVSIGLASLGYGIWALAWGTIAAELVFAVLILNTTYTSMPLDWTWQHTGSLIWESKLLFLMGIMGFVLQQGDVAIMGGLVSPKAIGFYAMAFTLVMQVSKIVETAVFRVIYPVFCEYQDDPGNLGRTYRLATIVITAVEAPIYFYLLFNSHVLVGTILGTKWLPAATLMQALSVFGIINPYCTFGNEVLRARKRDSVLTLSTAIGSATLVVFGYLLTRRYGVMGMVAAHYIMLGSIPTIIALYRIVRSDFILLTRGLAFIYISSLALIGIVSLVLSSVPYAQAILAGLLVPACWYTYYRVFDDGVSRRTVTALRSAPLSKEPVGP